MTEKTDPKTPQPAASAWEKDKLYGVRLDQVFPATREQPSEHFLLIGGMIDGQIDTEIGKADHVSLLVQKLDEKGRPTGMPFKVGTLASAIAEKMRAAVPTDFPAIVQTMSVESRFGRDAFVLQHVGETDPSGLLAEFGVAGDTLKAIDQLRPPGERLPI